MCLFIYLFFQFQIKDRKLWFTSQNNVSGNLTDVTLDAPVSDGLWHVVSLLTDTPNTILLVDSKVAFNITHRLDLTPLHVEKIVLGGGDNKVQQTGNQNILIISFWLTLPFLPMYNHGLTKLHCSVLNKLI